MRERTFRRPTIREAFRSGGVELPKKIDHRFIMKLINQGRIIPVRTYKDAVEVIDGFGFEDGKFALFPNRFRVSGEDSNRGIKSLESLAKIDALQVLRDVSGDSSVPRLTRQFAQQHKIWPYTLIKQAMKYQDVENPPVGYYWVGGVNQVSATTWIRCATAAEMEVMRREGDIEAEIPDKEFYGKALSVRVDSRLGVETSDHPFDIYRLPVFKIHDKRQYSEWIDLGHNSPDPDCRYRGRAHQKRKNPLIFWSAPAIFGFYEAMVFVDKHARAKKFGLKFRINPFCIPTNEQMIDFIDKLRLRSIIVHEDDGRLSYDVLNKTEMDKPIGARTILRAYDNCWHHWGRRPQKDLSYLYRPE